MSTYTELKNTEKRLIQEINILKTELQQKHNLLNDVNMSIPYHELLKVFYIRDVKKTPTITVVIIRDIETSRILAGVSKCYEYDKCTKYNGRLEAIKKAYEYQYHSLVDFVLSHKFIIPRFVFTRIIQHFTKFAEKRVNVNFNSTQECSNWVSQLVYFSFLYRNLIRKYVSPCGDENGNLHTIQDDLYSTATYILGEVLHIIAYKPTDKYNARLVSAMSLKSSSLGK